MQNTENNIEEVITTDDSGITKVKATKKVELTSLEAQVIARSEDLNEPALCAMFELTHNEIKTILAKK